MPEQTQQFDEATVLQTIDNIHREAGKDPNAFWARVKEETGQRIASAVGGTHQALSGILQGHSTMLLQLIADAHEELQKLRTLETHLVNETLTGGILEQLLADVAEMRRKHMLRNLKIAGEQSPPA